MNLPGHALRDKRAHATRQACHPSWLRTCALPACLALSLTGCMNLSGLGGSSDYACKAPDGVTCTSVSGTYANAVQDNLPAQVANRRKASSANNEPATTSTANAQPSRLSSMSPASLWKVPPVAQSASLALPLRSSARILRLWFKPWEDTDRDLYDQGYVYVQIDSGQWLIDHAQRQIRDAYAPIRPPVKPATTPAGAPVQSTSPTLPGIPQRPVSDIPVDPNTGPLLPPTDNVDIGN